MDELREPTHVKRIKRYDIIRRVGEGGMGKVYLGMDRIIRRPVALKLFSMESLPSEGTARDRIIRDFFLEIQTAGALLHPNIVVIHDVGKKGDVLYMVMEFVYGKTLLEYQRHSPLGIRKSVETIYELALALDYAHSRGVVHRDIKPENIMISSQGVPKITDFGIARFRKHLKGHRPSVVGSSRFMAPEQVLRREQDHRVDIYQLGIVLFELLTGQIPFKSGSTEETLTRVCTEPLPPPGRINPEVPEELDRIVARCVEKSATKRFSSARKLADALAQYLRTGKHPEIAADPELVSRLKRFEIFSLFTDREVEELVQVAEFVTCSAGDQIVKENENDSNFFVLIEGNAKVVKKSKVLSNFAPGSCFGQIGAFARQKRSAGVTAQEDCKLLQINALLFKELEPLLQLKMLHIVLRNLASLVISLDSEIEHLTAGAEPMDRPPTICPSCGFDNESPIDVCSRCGALPYVQSESSLIPAGGPTSPDES